jgi:hypothetical protein
MSSALLQPLTKAGDIEHDGVRRCKGLEGGDALGEHEICCCEAAENNETARRQRKAGGSGDGGGALRNAAGEG